MHDATVQQGWASACLSGHGCQSHNQQSLKMVGTLKNQKNPLKLEISLHIKTSVLLSIVEEPC